MVCSCRYRGSYIKQKKKKRRDEEEGGGGGEEMDSLSENETLGREMVRRDKDLRKKLTMAIEQYFQLAFQFYLCSHIVNFKLHWPFFFSKSLFLNT